MSIFSSVAVRRAKTTCSCAAVFSRYRQNQLYRPGLELALRAARSDTPPGPPTPRYRQEVSLYAAMPVMASIYGRNMIDTLHERMGGNAQLLGPDKPDSPDGMWGRIIGYWGHRDGDPVGIYGRDGPAFDYDFGAIQSGLDLYRNEYTNGQRDNAGLYLAIGRANADVEHNILDAPSRAARTNSTPSASAATGPASARTTGILTASCREPGTKTWT